MIVKFQDGRRAPREGTTGRVESKG